VSERLSDYDYALPEELVAQRPAARRDASRLLLLDREGGAVSDRRFDELPGILEPGDLLVVNDTRVLAARFLGRREGGQGQAEVLLHTPAADGHWIALVRPGKRMKPGSLFLGAEGLRIRLGEDLGGGNRRVSLESPSDWAEAMDGAGAMPLPPYIRRAADEADRESYQTHFAREDGAVAAPTAGLHFTPELLVRLQERGVETATVTLHVGLGTFLPVRSEDIAGHRMHRERFRVGAALRRRVDETRAAGGRVVAVGTTVVRCLESLDDEEWAGGDELERDTEIFIRPPYEFRRLDALITNFHLPRSTLIMLVSAFAGREAVLAAYEHAVRERYRFYSYGDAMLILGGRP